MCTTKKCIAASCVVYDFHHIQTKSVSFILPPRRYNFEKNIEVSTKEQDFLKKLGSRIRTLRHEKKLSLNHLSTRFGLEKSSVSKLENGKSNSTVLTLWNLSEALNVPVDRFFREDK